MVQEDDSTQYSSSELDTYLGPHYMPDDLEVNFVDELLKEDDIPANTYQMSAADQARKEILHYFAFINSVFCFH